MIQSVNPSVNLFYRLAQDLNIAPSISEKYLSVGDTETLASKVVQAYAKKHGVSAYGANIDDRDKIFTLIAAAGLSKIWIPPLYLTNLKDIPFKGPDDPKLKDKKEVYKFAKWLAKKIGYFKPLKVTTEDRMFLKLYLKFIENPEKAKKGLEFVLLHELGHIKHGHAVRKVAYSRKFWTNPLYLIINILTLGIFKSIAMARQHIKHEQEADKFAYEASKSAAEGGQYLFDLTHKYKFGSLKEKALFKLFHIESTLSHSSYKSRSLKIKAHLAATVA